MDHVRADHPAVLFLQRTLSLLTSRDNLLRRPLHRVEAQGFVVEQRSRSKAGAIEWLVGRKPLEPAGRVESETREGARDE